jgi:DNA polymerase-3 subunit gamma/tau
VNTPARSIFEEERPTRFDQLVGNAEVKGLARAFVEAEAYKPGFIITGSFGTGKSTLARLIARAIVCRNRQGYEPCGVCDPCSYSPRHTATWGEGITVRNCAEHGLEQLRADLQATYYSRDRPFVLVLDEFQRAKVRLHDQLLTWLEDEAANFVLLVVTADSTSVDPALGQRLFTLEMLPPTRAEMIKYLGAINRRRGLALPEDEIGVICDEGRNVPRECLHRLHRAGLRHTAVWP